MNEQIYTVLHHHQPPVRPTKANSHRMQQQQKHIAFKVLATRSMHEYAIHWHGKRIDNGPITMHCTVIRVLDSNQNCRTQSIEGGTEGAEKKKTNAQIQSTV